MKIVFEKKSLLEALEFCVSVVPGHAVLDCMKCLKIVPDTDRVTFMGTNMDQMAEAFVEAKVDDVGNPFLVDATMLYKIVKALEGPDITIKFTQNVCVVQSCGSSFKLAVVDPEDFPEFINFTERFNTSVNTEKLMDAISGTIFCASANNVQEAYRGIKFDFDSTKLTLIALDGFRVGVRKVDCVSDTYSGIVPTKTLEVIAKSFSGENVDVSADDKFIAFKNGRYKLISKLINGTFLDYHTAIPKDKSAKLVVETEKLGNMLTKANLVVGEKIRQPLVLKIGDDFINAQIISTLGGFEDIVPAQTEGMLEKIGLNNKYFLQAVKAIKDENVVLQFASAFQPVQVLPEDGSDKFLYIILPIRVKD